MASMAKVSADQVITLEGARKLPRQQRSRHLVEAVLDATARILARQGYDKVNTNLVAVVAGVSIGSLYQYFPNKEALVAAVAERHCAQLRANIITGFGSSVPSSLAEAITLIVRSVAAARRVEPDLHSVLESETPRFEPFDGHRTTVRAVVELLDALPTEFGVPKAAGNVAVHVAGEIVHALLHAALCGPQGSQLSAQAIEDETCCAVSSYLAARKG